MPVATPSLRTRPSSLLWVLGAAIVAVIGINAWLLQKDRAEVLAQSARTQRDLVHAVADRIETSMQKADLLATLLAQDYLRARADGNDELFRPALNRGIAAHPDLALALVVDREGRSLTGSLAHRPPPFSVADRDYFRHHQQVNDDKLFIGSTVTSRSGNRRIIPVSRRINDAYGRFAGVAMIGLAADELQRSLGEFTAGPNSLIGIAHMNGTVLLRVPEMGAIGRNLQHDPQFVEHYIRSREGAFSGVSPIDGRERHYVYRAIDGYPLVVVTAVAEADPLAGWMQALLLKSGYVLLVTAMLALLALYFYRQQHLIGRTLGLSRAVLDSTPCGIIAIAGDGRVLLFNRAAATLLGCRRRDGYARAPMLMHVPKDLRELLGLSHDEPLPADLPYRRVLEAAAARPLPEWTLRRADGERFPASLSVTPVRDAAGQAIGHVLVFDDLTREKALERMKTDFVSVVSHELRTPLTAINGAITILASTMKAGADARQARLLDMASEGCARLIRLVSDILDLNKLERGQMQLHCLPQPLRPLLEEALAQNETFASQHDVRYRLIAPAASPQVDIDRDRLLQVMTNLLSNAAKFSAPGGEVRVRMTAGDDEVVVAVEDDGAGIPAAFQPHVFERFSQSGSVATRSKGGSGLGLSIAKGFVDAHGGSLGFSSVEGVGTTFTLRLPCAAGNAPI